MGIATTSCLASQWDGGLALGQDHELDIFFELDSSPRPIGRNTVGGGGGGGATT